MRATSGKEAINSVVVRNPEVIEVTKRAELAYMDAEAIEFHWLAPDLRKKRYMVSSAAIGASSEKRVTKVEGLAAVDSDNSAKSGVKGWLARPLPTPSACQDWL